MRVNKMMVIVGKICKKEREKKKRKKKKKKKKSESLRRFKSKRWTLTCWSTYRSREISLTVGRIFEMISSVTVENYDCSQFPFQMPFSNFCSQDDLRDCQQCSRVFTKAWIFFVISILLDVTFAATDLLLSGSFLIFQTLSSVSTTDRFTALKPVSSLLSSFSFFSISNLYECSTVMS